MSRRGVLLDRDGTIIVDSGYVGAVEDVVFLDGAIEAIASLNAAGIPVAVVTNQAGVARGMYDVADVDLVHKAMAAEMARFGAHVDAWLYCPYHPDGTVAAYARTSADRKPGPGMALAAAAELDLDLTTSWVVGDSACDTGMARSVGAHPYRIGDPTDDDPDTDTVADLSTAVGLILAEHTAAPSPSDVAAFPARRYEDTGRYALDYAAQLSRAMAGIDPRSLRAAARLLDEAHERGATVFSCGNGGSASVANHFQCDHVKGVRLGTGLHTRVQSLSSNMEILSAIANDNGYENVFDFQLESMARPGDVLVAISSSGRSPNIVRALEWCADHDVPTIALTGFTGGRAREVATVSVHVDSSNYGVIEDAHQACMHLLAQYLRQSRMAATDVPTQVF